MDPNNTGPEQSYGPTLPPVNNDFSGGGGFNQNTKKNKIIVASMIVGVLLVVIVGFFVVTGRKDPNIQNMENVIAAHLEISRVSQSALNSDILGVQATNTAATANATAITNRVRATNILSSVFKGSLEKGFDEKVIDTTNDDKIKQGELLNRIDEAYLKLLKEMLIKANGAIASVEAPNSEVQVELDAMAESNRILFESYEVED